MKPIRFYLLAFIIAVADQLSKGAVLAQLRLGESRPAIGRLLYLTHAHNTGGAFSMFQAGNAIFIFVATIASAALIIAYQRMKLRELGVTTALSLALGGAIGNLIDRIRFGYVVDFFDFQGGTGHNLWPIFNVADSAIVVAICLLGWHFLFTRAPEPTDNASTASPETAEKKVP